MLTQHAGAAEYLQTIGVGRFDGVDAICRAAEVEPLGAAPDRTTGLSRTPASATRMGWGVRLAV